MTTQKDTVDDVTETDDTTDVDNASDMDDRTDADDDERPDAARSDRSDQRTAAESFPSEELSAEKLSAEASARARASVYGLLAATFDGETETLADALDEGAFVALADALPVEIETEPLERTDLDADALGVGYDNLFVVPGPHYVPPFASAHAVDPSEAFDSDSPFHDAGEAGELLGDPAADAAQLYTATGFEPDRGDGIPDHLAALLEFMRALCEREATLLTEESTDDELSVVRTAQRETLSLLAWLDTFDDAVAREDSAEGVFAALVRLARSFAAWDARDGVVAA